MYLKCYYILPEMPKTQGSQTYKNHLIVRTPLYIHTALSRWHGEEGIEMSSPLLLLDNKGGRGRYLEKQ
jgi:hypothetical protein